jgi:hypothetical protein
MDNPEIARWWDGLNAAERDRWIDVVADHSVIPELLSTLPVVQQRMAFTDEFYSWVLRQEQASTSGSLTTPRYKPIGAFSQFLRAQDGKRRDSGARKPA